MKIMSFPAPQKTYLLAVASFLFPFFAAFGQNKVMTDTGARIHPVIRYDSVQADSGKVYSAVGEKPVFPGGEVAMAKYFRDNLRYPDQARKDGIQGIVFVAFIIEKDGHVGKVTVMQEVGGGCDGEAVRLIKSMPAWTPGRHKGLPVRVRLTVPVKFAL